MVKLFEHRFLGAVALLIATGHCSGNFTRPDISALSSDAGTETDVHGSAGAGGNIGTTAPPITDISGIANGPLASFIQQVWGPTVSQDCLACHVTRGYAPSHGAAFILQPPSQTGYLTANHKTFSDFANRQVNGKSYLLQKVTNSIAHGGGQRMVTGDTRYQQIESWIASPGTGADLQLTSDKVQSLRMLDDSATLRRAAMQLAQRLPTPQEIALAQQGNLDIALDSVLTSGAFLTFVWNTYNKLFSFSNTLAGNYVASDRMDSNLFTGEERYWWFSTDNSLGQSSLSEASVGYQAENLATYIVANNRPFTEMVTANYFMANPFGAHVYGVFDKVSWLDPNNGNEYQAIPARSLHCVDRHNAESVVELTHEIVSTVAAYAGFSSTTIAGRLVARRALCVLASGRFGGT